MRNQKLAYNSPNIYFTSRETVFFVNNSYTDNCEISTMLLTPRPNFFSLTAFVESTQTSVLDAFHSTEPFFRHSDNFCWSLLVPGVHVLDHTHLGTAARVTRNLGQVADPVTKDEFGLEEEEEQIRPRDTLVGSHISTFRTKWRCAGKEREYYW